MKKQLKMKFSYVKRIFYINLLVTAIIILPGKSNNKLYALDNNVFRASDVTLGISHQVPGSRTNNLRAAVVKAFEYRLSKCFSSAGINFFENANTGKYLDKSLNWSNATSQSSSITDCIPVSIETQPVSGNLCSASETASFTIGATGTFPFSWQWQYYNGNTWINITNGTPEGASYTGANTETLNVTGITATGSFKFKCYVTNCGGANNTTTNIVTLNVNETPIKPVIESIIQPTCSIVTGSVVLSGLPSGGWTINPGNHSGSGSSTTISGIIAGTYNFNVTNAAGCTSEISDNMTLIAHATTPIAKAGFDQTYTGTPILIGSAVNGPGAISWSPSAGLNDVSFAQPLASPLTTTTYTLTVDNNGCISTDDITLTIGDPSHIINGRTIYAAKANPGSYGNNPTYNEANYNINNVIVILKNYPAGTELARDTSDALGEYKFTTVLDGTYMLSYSKYTEDTMQWGNDVNVADVALLMYLIGVDTLADPSKCFSAKYKGAGDVDNNGSINVIDIARIKSKIGAPYQVVQNFPNGNWHSLDTIITVAGSDLNINLETICNGDYNASSSKYRDSLTTWSNTKSLSNEIIATSEEYITTSNQSYFEVPLKINTKMADFSALGLELNYPDKDYKLVNAYIPKAHDKTSNIKINPELEETIANHNDLLVTDENGLIRVVYATTNHFDVEANDEIIILGFRPLKNLTLGEIDFNLSGTGVVANQYGEEKVDVFLTMPKIFVQDNNVKAGFDLTGYPNPFNGEATITYNIPDAGTVKINVYDAIGKMVSELLNETQPGGTYSVKYFPENLPQGMYTFKLEYTGSGNSQCLNMKMIH